MFEEERSYDLMERAKAQKPEMSDAEREMHMQRAYDDLLKLGCISWSQRFWWHINKWLRKRGYKE